MGCNRARTVRPLSQVGDTQQMSRPIVVTGSSGRIGQALASKLMSLGSDVIGIDVHPGAFTTHVADLAIGDTSRLLQGCSVVVHCAALHAPHIGRATVSDFVATNVAATERLVAAASDAGVKRFVFTSTTSVYGNALVDPDLAVWVDEDLPPQPRDVYDTTKLEAEQIVAAAHSHTLSSVTLRVARCFPEDWRSTVVNRLYRGVDIRDAVAGITAAATAELREHHTLNLAGPRVFERDDAEWLRRDAAALLRRRFPALVTEFARRQWPLPESLDRIYVADRAQRVLDWAPVHGIESALQINPGTVVSTQLPTAC